MLSFQVKDCQAFVIGCLRALWVLSSVRTLNPRNLLEAGNGFTREPSRRIFPQRRNASGKRSRKDITKVGPAGTEERRAARCDRDRVEQPGVVVTVGVGQTGAGTLPCSNDERASCAALPPRSPRRRSRRRRRRCSSPTVVFRVVDRPLYFCASWPDRRVPGTSGFPLRSCTTSCALSRPSMRPPPYRNSHDLGRTVHARFSPPLCM